MIVKTKILALLLAAALFCSLVSCGPPQAADANKLQIVATLFPQYDFAREIVGDKGEVTLLLPNGVDVHSFDPTTADVITINQSDLFIYTGDDMEVWVPQIIDASDTALHVLNVSQGITLLEESHDGHAHGEHAHAHDPHVWTSPKNAMIMVDNILNAVCALDPDNAAFYKENAARYTKELEKLDAQFLQIAGTAKTKTILFAGRFACNYFAQEYGFSHIAAFDSCSENAEPASSVVAELIDRIKADGIEYVYYEELTDPKTARVLSEETGCKSLLFHSCHNISKAEARAGATYLSLMQQNAENLRKGLC